MDDSGWLTSRSSARPDSKSTSKVQLLSSLKERATARAKAASGSMTSRQASSSSAKRSSDRRRSDSESSASEDGEPSSEESECSDAEKTRVMRSGHFSDSESDSASRRRTTRSSAASRSESGIGKTRSNSRRSEPKTRFEMASAAHLDDSESNTLSVTRGLGEEDGGDDGGWVGRGAAAATAESPSATSKAAAVANTGQSSSAGAGAHAQTAAAAAATVAASKKLSATAARDRKIDAFAADVVAFCRTARRNIDAAIVSGSALVAGKRQQVARVIRAPRSLTGHLHPHQLAGLNWLLALWATNIMGVLADDMGLGKTIQVIALLAQLREFELEDAHAPYEKALAGQQRTGDATPAWPSHAATPGSASSAGLAAAGNTGAGAGATGSFASMMMPRSAAASSSSSSASGFTTGSGAGAQPTGTSTGTGSLELLAQLPGAEQLHSLPDEDIFAMLDEALDARKQVIVQKSAASATDLASLIAAADATSARTRGKQSDSDGDSDSEEDSDDDSDDEDDDDSSDDDDDDDDLNGYSSRAAADAAKAAAASAAALLATPHGRLAAAVRAEADGHVLALQARGSSGPHLIIVPTSTAENWCRELAKWCPALTVLPFTGGEAARRADVHRIGTTSVTVTTYSLIERPDVQRALKRVRWAVLVLDEAHSLKNAASKRFAAVGELRARMRLLLTGTPVQNNLRELTTLLRLGLADLFMGVTGTTSSGSSAAKAAAGRFKYEAGDDSFSLAAGGGDDDDRGGRRGGGGGGGGDEDDGLSQEERSQMMLVEALERAYAREMKAAQAAAAAAARAAKASAKRGSTQAVGSDAAATAASTSSAPDAVAGAAVTVASTTDGGATSLDGGKDATGTDAGAGSGSGGLGDLFAALVLRRTKDAVLSELPPKTRRVEWAGMTPSQQAAADTIHSLVMALDPAGASLLCQATITALTASPAASSEPSTGAGAGAGAGAGTATASSGSSGGHSISESILGPIFVAQLAYCVGAPPSEAAASASASVALTLGAAGSGAGAMGGSGAAATAVLAAQAEAMPAASGRRLTAMERELASLKDGLTAREVPASSKGKAVKGAGASSASAALAMTTASAGASGITTSSGASLSRVIMLMRKVANHPLLLRLRYTDAAVMRVARLLHQLRAQMRALSEAAAPPAGAGARGAKAQAASGAAAKAAQAAAAAAKAAAEAQLSKRRRIDAEFEDEDLGVSSSGAGGLSSSRTLAADDSFSSLQPSSVHPLRIPPSSTRYTLSVDADADLPWATLPALALRQHSLTSATDAAGAVSTDTAGAVSPSLPAAGATKSRGATVTAPTFSAADASPAGKALALLPPGALPSFHRLAATGHTRPDEETLLLWANGNEELAYEAQSMLDASDFDIDRSIADALSHSASLPGMSRSAARAALQRLRLPREALLDCGKARLLESLLASLSTRGSRALLFSQFTGVLDILEAMLDVLGHKHVRIDGSVAAASRQGIVDKFAEDESILVFLLSTRAGGVGLNLTAADTVVLYDSDWNPTNDSQAEDRAYRIGQTKPVTVYRLLTPGTIEVHMADVTGGKWAMAQKLMSMSER